MKIAYNPITAAALTTAPANNDITFDLKGLNIFVRGVKFKGTDTTYSVFKKHTSSSGGGYNGLVPVPSYTSTNTRFLREDGSWVVPTNTDNKVTQDNTTTSNFRPIILGYNNSTDLNDLSTSVTNQVYTTTKIYAQPSTGYLWATKLYSGGKEVLTSHQSLSNYVTINGNQIITGQKNFNTRTSTVPLIISRNGSSTTECVKHSVNDSQYILDYINDEISSGIIFKLTNTDTEGSDGSDASTTTFSLKSNKTILIDNTYSVLTSINSSYGTQATNYIPLKINNVTKNISLNGHKHSVSDITNFTHNHSTSQITSLTGYVKATSNTALKVSDSLNTALGKLEYKGDLGVTAYNLVNAAYDGDGTIENLEEILRVLEGISDTDTIKELLGKYLPLTGGTMTGTLNTKNITVPQGYYIYSTTNMESGGSMLHFDGTKTVLGSVGSSTSAATHIRSKTGHATIGTSTSPLYTIWDSGNLNPEDFADVSHTHSNYVTKNTDQTISGIKTFSKQQKFTVAKGTSPFTVTSDTLVTNLNADMLDGYHLSDIKKDIGYSWIAKYRVNSWSRIMKIDSYSNILLSINFSQNSQASNHLYLISTGFGSGNIIQLGANQYGSNYAIKVRLTENTNTSYNVEIFSTYGYNGATELSINCKYIKMDNTSTVTAYTTYIIGGGTVEREIISSYNKIVANLQGNSDTATKFLTQRQINGTNFDGTANITTSYWGSTRTLTIGNIGKSVNGSGNVSWSLSEIGAAATNHTHNYITMYRTSQLDSDTFSTYVKNYAKGLTVISNVTANVGNIDTTATVLNVGYSTTRFWRIFSSRGTNASIYFQGPNSDGSNWDTKQKILTSANSSVSKSGGTLTVKINNVTQTLTNTNTVNTAGATDTSSKIYLIGATSQSASPVTYSHNTVYVGTDGCLYSNNTKVSVNGHTHNNIVSRGNVTAESGVAGRPAVVGLSMSQAYNNGYPYNYGNVISLRGRGDGQIFVGWSGTDGAHAPVYVRSKRDSTTANWSGWARFYTTAYKPTPADIGAATSGHNHDSTYVNITGDTMTGYLRFPNNAGIIQNQNSTSNYTVPIKWYKGGTSQNTYNPQIGQHNTGGDGTGSICILPYPTSTDPWIGTVGLFISKNNLKIDNQKVWHAGNDGSNSGLDADLLDGKHASSFMLKTEEITNNVTSINKTLDVSTSWMDTGIAGNDLQTGTYILQLYVNDSKSFYSTYHSGIISWYKDNTNDSETDEIILHRAGHAYHKTVYLRTVQTSSGNGGMKLQIAASSDIGASIEYKFKFKRII